MTRPHIAIVGGGISGLATAYFLEHMAECDITLFEAAERLGGKVKTSQEGPFLIEAGPDCFFALKGGTMELACELDLQDELIAPEGGEFSMLIGGALHRVPHGLLSLMRVDGPSVEQADFLTEEAKARVLDEASAPKGEGDDESIASFFRRRFGEEFSKLIAEPLLAGTHAGDPDKLSMRALYPHYFSIERQHGSLGAAPPPPAPPQTGKKQPMFFSLKGGMSSVIDALQGRLLHTTVLTAAPVDKVTKSEIYTVEANGKQYAFDQVVLAAPAYVAAEALKEMLPNASGELKAIPHASSTIVTFGFRKKDLAGELRGTGFLVPQSEPSDITGATWTSNKWPTRSPDDHVLIRVFMGRSGGLDVETRTDEELLQAALEAITPLAGIRGKPIMTQIQRWQKGLPQYEIGHLDRIKRIEESLATKPGLYVTGTSFRGVGLPDCIKDAKATATRIAESLK